ncbi:MAG: DNA-directed RNA polymerase subunit omega [Clostridia bacterium]|jgi:DNA-directed RNA polymerase subunit omega|nr:DNA-directed RNA polymerase subunit omega [Clostridia bacterium]
MMYPGVSELKDKADCRYTLVVESAKRARQLVEGAQPLTEENEANPVSQAAKEILLGKITYIAPEEE